MRPIGLLDNVPRELEKPSPIIQTRELVPDRRVSDLLGPFQGCFARSLALHDAPELGANVGHQGQKPQIGLLASLRVKLEHGDHFVADQDWKSKAAADACLTSRTRAQKSLSLCKSLSHVASRS